MLTQRERALGINNMDISPGEYVENLAQPGKIGVPKMF